MPELLELEPLPLASELLLPAVVSVLDEPVAAVEPLDVEPTWAEPDELPLMLPLALPETPLVVVSELLDEAGVVSELLRVS